jgi:hypothetical protein
MVLGRTATLEFITPLEVKSCTFVYLSASLTRLTGILLEVVERRDCRRRRTVVCLEMSCTSLF